MINLDGIKPFAEGGNRMCFVHPDNPGRCLKVVHPGLPSKIKKSKSWYKSCLLYTSDAADDGHSVDLGGRRIIKTFNRSKSLIPRLTIFNFARQTWMNYF